MTLNRILTRLRTVVSKSNYLWSYPYLDPAPVPGDLIAEIGSRDAVDAVLLSRRFATKVVAFEPVPENIRKCEETLAAASWRHRRRVSLDPRCLTSVDGPVEFKAIETDSYDNPGAGSIYELDFSFRPQGDPDRDHTPIQKSLTVTGIRYDSTTLPAPHSVFMDVQGAELEALLGFGPLIESVRNIVLETSLRSTYRGGCDFWQLHEFLTAAGFRYRASSRHGDELPPRIRPEVWDGEFNVVFTRP